MRAYGIDREAALSAEWRRVSRYIEAHLAEPLTTAKIASACGLSEFHFTRRFRWIADESPMEFVRRRRLERASGRLIRTMEPVAEIALNSGYASQSAFTRAFKRAFGQAPAEARRRGIIEQPRRRSRMTKPVLTVREERREAFLIAGLSAPLEPATYTEGSELWKRAVARLVAAGLMTGGETIGGFRDRDPAARSFMHLAGVRVEPDAALPEDLEVWSQPARTWRIYRQVLTAEALHLQIMAAQDEIMRQDPAALRPEAGGDDLQVYPTPFVLEGGWLEHWLPVKD